jgi:hypothetical protein
MATYQIINLQTGEFRTVSLDAAATAQLDPNEIELAIEEHGVCETNAFQITKLPEPPEGNGPATNWKVTPVTAIPFFRCPSSSTSARRSLRRISRKLPPLLSGWDGMNRSCEAPSKRIGKG